jgi:hypothetical protein
MNFTYFKLHDAYNDSGPSFDEVLREGERPTWPNTLQILELEHIRRWSTGAAEMFFQSLIDSAPHLPHLRQLVIKAVLDIAWRQRSTLRDKWVHKFNEVFKRVSKGPMDHSALRKKASAAAIAGTAPGQHEEGAVNDATRRSSRIASAHSNENSLGRNNTRPSYWDSDSDDDLPLARQAFHGMCDHVDIRLDNQKPAEHQYQMDDFLDSDHHMSEASWDGDWDSDDDRHAW